KLAASPDVALHGYQPAERVAALIDAADAFICTSHEEGLCLPLLEAQHAGLPIIVPDQSVFREVLGASGLYVDPEKPAAAADAVVGCLAHADWRPRHAMLATQNLSRWNTLARADRDTVIETIAHLGDARSLGAAAVDARHYRHDASGRSS